MSSRAAVLVLSLLAASASGAVIVGLFVAVTTRLRKPRRPVAQPGRDRRAAAPLEPHFGEAGDRDVVDEASWESFPASDPPAF